MSTSPTTAFTGSSNFSSSFQQVITRAVGIAQLPGNQLRSERQTVSNQSTALSPIESKFSSLQTAIAQLDTAISGSQVTATTSTGGVLSTTVSNALPGTYNVNILTFGSSTTTLSTAALPTVADPTKDGLSTSTSLTLTVNGTARTLTPTNTSLNALAASINSNADLGVRATIVQFGTSAAPSYRLSLQSSDVGSNTISLSDGTTSLLDTLTTGTPMTYQLNGVTSTTISANSRKVTIAPGLSITAVAVGQTDVIVSTSANSIANALSNFASAYNSASTAVDAQRGPAAGILAGQSIVSQFTGTLNQIAGYYTGASGAGSLADIGLSFDKNGVMSFDASIFNTAISANPTAVNSFLGRTATGGFVKAMNDSLTAANSAGDEASIGYALSMTDYDTKIANADAQVALIQTNLTAQMSTADALVASLEQQVNYITGLFAAQNTLANSKQF